MPRFGGPVFSSVLSRTTYFSSLNSMSRIREGRTWMFHYNLYLYVIRFLKSKAYLGQQILRRNFIEPFVVKTSSVYLLLSTCSLTKNISYNIREI